MPQSQQEVEYLVIGQVLAPRGVRGEIKVRVETDDPGRFLDLETVHVGPSRRAMDVRRARLFKGMALVQLYDITDTNAANELRGQYLYVTAKQALPLEENEYYHHQLEGMRVVTDAGQELGTLREIIITGANDVYVVQGESGQVLLPAIRDVVRSVDLASRTMTVTLIDGLLPE